IFSGLATLKYEGDHFYEALLRKSRAWIPTMPYESVAILLQSMAKVRIRDKELEGKVALRLAADIDKAATEAEISEIALWMGSLTHHFSKLAGEQDHRQSPPAGRPCHVAGMLDADDTSAAVAAHGDSS
ncbi:hypothetical protein FOZ63_020358, partial [Perkinsus olseni]